MLFSDLNQILNGSLFLAKDLPISNFYTDTRAASGNSGDVFVALHGSKREGHEFISDAIEKGIKNFIVEKPISDRSVNSIVVGDTLKSFQKIAQYHRKLFDYPVIGITGSNGKTTVKEWLSILLSQRYSTIKSPKSYNSQIGVPISILNMNDHHEVAVFEAGISKKGEMGALREIIQPTIGIFTMLGEAHDDGFASQEEKLEEKLGLFDQTKQVVCQSDQPWFHLLKERLGEEKLVTWALTGESQFPVSWNPGSVTVGDTEFKVSLSDQASLQNITHCIIVAKLLGLSKEEIKKGLDEVRTVPMRLELKKGINGCYLLDDTYNNDLEGLKVAMDYLDGQRQNEKKTLILSDIIHSRKPSDELYSEIADLIREKNFDRFIGVGTGIREHQDTFGSNATFFDNVNELLENVPLFDHEMILIKGARNYQLEKLVKKLEEKNHGTILEVNFEALQHNLNAYRRLLKRDTKIMVMVKANAYGSGLLEVSNFLQHQHVDYLGVAYVDEAVELRKNGIALPIMIMNPYIESFEQFEQFDLEPEVFSMAHLQRFLSDAKNPPPIHIKIDTGMHRLGFSPDELPELLDFLLSHQQIKVASIFTHFSASDAAEHDGFTKDQAERFNEAYDQICTAIGYFPIKHSSNSAAMVRWPEYHFDMVRLGIGLHGYDPSHELDLKPVSQLKSSISQIQDLKKGDTVGYSRSGILERDSRIAVIPIGYEDGFLRVFGNGQFQVKINGQLYPTVGNICMDMCMIDVTGGHVEEGDEVIIFDDASSINRMAAVAETITHEVLTNISSRVKRVFVSE